MWGQYEDSVGGSVGQHGLMLGQCGDSMGYHGDSVETAWGWCGNSVDIEEVMKGQHVDTERTV